MNKVAFYIFLGFCIILFYLGFFALEETTFGWWSPYWIVSILLIFGYFLIQHKNRIRKIEERLSQFPTNVNKEGKNNE